MKPSILSLVLSLAVWPVLSVAQETKAPASAGSPPKAAPAPAAARVDDDPTLEKLKSLTPDQQEKVKKALSEASAFVGGIRLQEALQRLVDAEVLAPDLFMVHNLRGAVFTKMRLFGKARESFKKAQELHPTSFHPKFNLAEIEFVEAADKARSGDEAAAKTQFASAQKMFEALIPTNPEIGTRRLMEFKVVICKLKQGLTEEAEKAVKAFSYIDDEPVYYLGHAAIEFNRGDKAAAQEWIDSANRIYAPQQISIYMDSFIEVGWVETLAL